MADWLWPLLAFCWSPCLLLLFRGRSDDRWGSGRRRLPTAARRPVRRAVPPRAVEVGTVRATTTLLPSGTPNQCSRRTARDKVGLPRRNASPCTCGPGHRCYLGIQHARIVFAHPDSHSNHYRNTRACLDKVGGSTSRLTPRRLKCLARGSQTYRVDQRDRRSIGGTCRSIGSHRRHHGSTRITPRRSNGYGHDPKRTEVSAEALSSKTSSFPEGASSPGATEGGT